MGNRKEETSLLGNICALLPPGVAHYIGAVMSMIVASGLLIVVGMQTLFSEAEIGTRMTVQLILIVLFALIIVHPTFMLTRGKRWPRRFLKHLNHLMMVALLLLLIWSLWFGAITQLLIILPGLACSLGTFTLYRSRGFVDACEHYIQAWGRSQ